jgi:hypothetical protein
MATTAGESLSFKEAERSGWGEKAPVYDDFAGQITVGVVGPMLDALAVGAGTRFLDVCCGPGYLAAAAAARGADAEGIDFAAAMVDEARQRFPGGALRERATPRRSTSPMAASTPSPAPSASSTSPTPTGHSPRRTGCWRPAAATPSRCGWGRSATTSSASSARPSPPTAQPVELPPAPPMFRFADA